VRTWSCTGGCSRGESLLFGENARQMRIALEILFWLSAGLIVWTQLGYAPALALVAVVRPGRLAARGPSLPDAAPLPTVSLIVAAHDEQESIAAKVSNALALDYPR
jgi:cellulose synthase/poly-beta-1,6-N-acetylglucosamine synthase-like glycosyltransferase